MPTGRQVLNQLYSEQEKLQEALNTAQRAANTNQEQLTAVRSREVAILKQLADIRLKAYSDQAPLYALGEADDVVKILMSRRTQLLTSTQQAIIETIDKIRVLQKACETAFDRAGETRKSCMAGFRELRESLSKTTAYRDLIDQRHALVQRIGKLTTRLEKAEEDVAHHRPTFLADVLFAYLNGRKFGTPAYRHAGPVRVLDTWVARVCGYKDAAQRYAVLTRLPDLINTCLEVTRSDLNDVRSKLGTAERKAIQGSPLQDMLEEDHEASQAYQAACDSLLDARERLKSLRADEAAFQSKQDSFTKDAMQMIDKALSSADIKKLTVATAETRDSTDDALINELKALRKSKAELEARGGDLATSLSTAAQAVSRASSCINGFRSRGYADGTFNGGFDGSSLMLGYIAGSMTEQAIWGSMSSAYSEPIDTSSASMTGGGFGGGSMFSGGGFGGGGFSTGGGF